MGFPNKAGDHADTDDILRAELKAAGIPTVQEAEGQPPEYLADFFRRTSGEVKTSVMGNLHGWSFKRAWYYWMAEGPGIDVDTAEALHATHGRSVRVAGHCGCPSPSEWFKGLGCGNYHVDSPEGLKALADAIKSLVKRAEIRYTELKSPEGFSLDALRHAAQSPSREMLTAAVDAAMVEMKNISPPLKRTECEQLIRAALTAFE